MGNQEGFLKCGLGHLELATEGGQDVDGKGAVKDIPNRRNGACKRHSCWRIWNMLERGVVCLPAGGKGWPVA